MSLVERVLAKQGERVLLMGNEAIARGVIESNVKVAVGYPGTPSSEIIMTLSPISNKVGMYAEWATNEKVAFEIALGAAMSGIRSLATMKAPGFNVASDSIVSAAYTGVNKGLVIVIADDPGPHTTQTEQDNRWAAKLAKLPMIEPSNVQEALDYVKKAYRFSEALKLPVIYRTTTRINHTVSDVVVGEISFEKQEVFVEYNPERYIRASMSWNRKRHEWLLEQLAKAEDYARELGFNRVEGDGEYCILTSGVSYNYVVEGIRKLQVDAKVIKLELTYPWPEDFVLKSINVCKRVLVVEELDPYLEEHLRLTAQKHGLDIDVWGKRETEIPLTGELSPTIVMRALSKFFGKPMHTHENVTASDKPKVILPQRPPPMCPGCPHRGSYMGLLKAIQKSGYRKREVPIMGDIGCYALSLEPPLEAIWTEHAMGASIGLAMGIKIAGYDKPVVATIGDSTFFHAGMPALVEAVNKNVDLLVMILDNISIAMTGHQSTPEFTETESGRKIKPVKIEDVVKGMGVEYARVVDPFNLDEVVEVVTEALKKPGVKVIIARRECSLQALRKGISYKPPEIDRSKCTDCMACVRATGCPAIIDANGKPYIIEDQCYGCILCAQVCPFNAFILRDNPLKVKNNG